MQTTMIIIRPPRWKDIPHIIGLARTYHRASCFASLPFDEDRVVERFAILVRGGPDVFARLAEIDGMLAGIVTGHRARPWCSTAHDAREGLLYVAPRFRGTRTALRLWRSLSLWCRSTPSEAPTPDIGSEAGAQDVVPPGVEGGAAA